MFKKILQMPSITWQWMAIELCLIAYLGSWNAIVPFWIASKNGHEILVTYEVLLAGSALIGIPLLAPVVEKISKSTVLRLAMSLIFACTIVRSISMFLSLNVIFIMVSDVIAALSFAAIQPLFGVYAVEFSSRSDVSSTLQKQKGLQSLGKILGPSLAAFILVRQNSNLSLIIPPILCLIPLIFSFIMKIPDVKIRLVRKPGLKAYFADAVEGIKLKFKLKSERFFTICLVFIQMCGLSLVPIIIPILITKDISISHSEINAASVAASTNMLWAGGILIGAVFIAPVLDKYFSVRKAWIMLITVFFSSFLFVFFAQNSFLRSFSVAFCGAAFAPLSIFGMGHRMIVVGSNCRVRVAAANLMFTQFASMIGFSLFGYLAKSDGVIYVTLIVGAMFMLITVLSWFFSSPWALLKQPIESLNEMELAHGTSTGLLSHGMPAKA